MVTKSGDLDGTFIYSYDGQGIVEIRNGSGDVVNQVYRGTEYIDEIVAMRFEEGYAVILQDANFNVVGAVDMAGQFLERVFYEPYGLPLFEGETRFGDYDGDHSVDSTDDADLGSGQTCWGADPTGACRVFDFNFDLTLDASDETVMTAMTSLSSTEHRVYGRTISPIGLRFLHQGLEHDPEISSYQNRARQYLPVNERFAQRDPMEYEDGLNLYIYALGNPPIYLDPNGQGVVAIPYPGWVWPVGGGCAAADGPLPIGDAVGVCVIVGGTVIWVGAKAYCYFFTSSSTQAKPQQERTCSDSIYEKLKAGVQLYCKDFPPRACKRTDECRVINFKIANILACSAARRKMNKQCWGGGDDGHKQAVSQLDKQLNDCLKYKYEGCGFDF